MSLREVKRARTRQALIDAAAELFERDGYDATTIADITAAAEVGARTFFGYFASKEDLLFPDAEARVRAALDAIDSRGPAEPPVDVLLRALRVAGQLSDDLTGPLAALRLRFAETVPAVRGHGLRLQLEAQRAIARRLAAAYPELGPVRAGALTGAFIGAITGALQALQDHPAEPDRAAALRIAVEVALGRY
jgi:AcrR family transcriptional regulator